MFPGTPAALSQQPQTLTLFSDQLGHAAAVVDIWLSLENMTSPKTFPLSLGEGQISPQTLFTAILPTSTLKPPAPLFIMSINYPGAPHSYLPTCFLCS